MVDEIPAEKSNDAVNSSQSPNSASENTLSILERAEKLNKETKDAEVRIAEHRKQIEELETRRILGGATLAGSINKTAEQLEKEKADEMANEIVRAFGRK